MVEYCALLVAKALCLAVVQVEAIKYRRYVLAGVVFLLESLLHFEKKIMPIIKIIQTVLELLT